MVILRLKLKELKVFSLTFLGECDICTLLTWAGFHRGKEENRLRAGGRHWAQDALLGSCPPGEVTAGSRHGKFGKFH